MELAAKFKIANQNYVLNALFKVFDADHSGELDFAEFVKVPGRNIS